MNKVIAVFLLVAVSAVLSHPGQARDDAIASPVAIALDAAQPVPPVESSPAPVPEEQPTSAALLDDATAQPVTLPAGQEAAAEGSSNDNIAPIV